MAWATGFHRNLKENSAATHTYFVSLPRPDFVLVCNDRDFLSEMLSRITSPKGPRAMPATLPEWKYVDRSTPLWAVRHYRADRISIDPSRSLTIEAIGKNPDAVGLAVEFGLEPGVVKARMISKSDPWKELAVYPAFRGFAQSRGVASGVWELSLTTKPDLASEVVFLLMSALGFVVII